MGMTVAFNCLIFICLSFAGFLSSFATMCNVHVFHFLAFIARPLEFAAVLTFLHLVQEEEGTRARVSPRVTIDLMDDDTVLQHHEAMDFA